MLLRNLKLAGCGVIFGSHRLVFGADGLAQVDDTIAPQIASAVALHPASSGYEIVEGTAPAPAPVVGVPSPGEVLVEQQSDDLMTARPNFPIDGELDPEAQAAEELKLEEEQSAAAPEVDPATVELTVRDLKQRLYAAGVDVPSSALKADLIRLAVENQVSLD